MIPIYKRLSQFYRGPIYMFGSLPRFTQDIQLSGYDGKQMGSNGRGDDGTAGESCQVSKFGLRPRLILPRILLYLLLRKLLIDLNNN